MSPTQDPAGETDRSPGVLLGRRVRHDMAQPRPERDPPRILEIARRARAVRRRATRERADPGGHRLGRAARQAAYRVPGPARARSDRRARAPLTALPSRPRSPPLAVRRCWTSVTSIRNGAGGAEKPEPCARISSGLLNR